MSSNPNPSFDEMRWVIQIRQTLEEELEDDGEVPVNIFNVPKPLMAIKPACYVPQELAVGPYHHWRPELYEMERYKVAAAKRTQRHLNCESFHNLVDQLSRHEPRIRACYHKFLDFNGETLAWMMAIDAAFLLEFLQIYAIKAGRILTRVSSRMSHLVDYAGTKSAHNAILRDMVMVENQIPMFVLRMVLEFQFSTLDQVDDLLCSMLAGFGEDLCPFEMMKQPQIHIEEEAHLLDFLYHLIVPRSKQTSEIIEVDDEEEPKEGKEEESGDPSSVQRMLQMIGQNVVSTLCQAPIGLLKRLLFSGLLKFMLKLPWKIISNLPGFSILKQPVESIFLSEEKEIENSLNTNSNSNIIKPPLIEEIAIPSVSELRKSGVQFSPTNGSISSITFDTKTATLYLPIITLDVNTDVILRNLVAYEAANASGPLIITRYTELMNGIIDTEEDVKLLRERGIILNRLKSDEEAAELWNGMSKSIRLTKVPFLDKAIEDVNKYYTCIWQVKAGRFMKRYVFGSWQFLTFLATLFILLLLTLQAFCSVYSCPRTFHIPTTANET